MIEKPRAPTDSAGYRRTLDQHESGGARRRPEFHSAVVKMVVKNKPQLVSLYASEKSLDLKDKALLGEHEYKAFENVRATVEDTARQDVLTQHNFSTAEVDALLDYWSEVDADALNEKLHSDKFNKTIQ